MEEVQQEVAETQKERKRKEKVENATGGEGPKGSNSRLVEKFCGDLEEGNADIHRVFKGQYGNHAYTVL